MDADLAWVPSACTLPSVAQPLRIAEFDALFTTALRGQSRPTATRLRLVLDSAAGYTARELTERETGCCSFFTFIFQPNPDTGTVWLDVEAPTARVAPESRRPPTQCPASPPIPATVKAAINTRGSVEVSRV